MLPPKFAIRYSSFTLAIRYSPFGTRYPDAMGAVLGALDRHLLANASSQRAACSVLPRRQKREMVPKQLACADSNLVGSYIRL